jgi:hypothetical protein
MTAHPRNYLETVLNASQVERAARRILEERHATAQQEAPKFLREINKRDHAGRTITTFEGSPGMWMSQFAAPPRKVVSIQTKFK